MNLNPIAGSADVADDEADGVRDVVIPAPHECDDTVPPLVRIREEHNISRRDIDPDALKVLYRLARNNFIAYLVGGGVRDLLLGRKPKDFDISTNARPEQIRSLFRNCILIGRRFRLAHIRYGEKIIETSTFRRTPDCVADPNDPEADLFQRDDNLFGSPQEDALRRDFTVNGLFYDIETFSIIDYVGGIDDLNERLIRSIGDPCIRFREDPVRMVRAVRFASRLGFDIEPDTLDAICKHGDELAKASPARLLEEITRLFAFSSGERAVRLLHGTGLLRVILPEVSECLDDPKYDPEPFWSRLRALDDGDTVLPDATPALIFSTLLLDALKRKLGRDWSVDDFPRLRFDKVHAFLEPMSQRLRFPRKLVDRIVHIYLSQYRFLGSGGKRGSIANFVVQDSFHESLALSEIVHTAEGKPQTNLNQWRDLLVERIYGRDESAHGSHERRRHGGNDNGEQRRDAGGNASGGGNGQGEEAPGQKLSRSARRRRNKRMKQLRGREGDAIAKQAAAPEQPQAATAEPKAESKVEAIATGQEAPAKTGNRRERPRRRAAKTSDRHPAPSGHDEVAGGDFKPLTAAAFWAAPEPEPQPEPEPAAEAEPAKKKGGRKAKPAARKSAKAAAEETAPESGEPEKPKPLAMDRADEADIPMHWLDEI